MLTKISGILNIGFFFLHLFYFMALEKNGASSSNFLNALVYKLQQRAQYMKHTCSYDALEINKLKRKHHYGVLLVWPIAGT